MSQIWRVHLRSDGEDPCKFCIQNHVVGVGWPIEHSGPVDWDTYRKVGSALYHKNRRGWATALNAIHDRMQIDDLCWARDLDGRYYLGRVTSDWRYENDDAHRKADMVNVRTAEWVKLSTSDSVPGTVLRHFIKGPTIRQIPSETVAAISQYLYNEGTGIQHFHIHLEIADLYQLLSAQDLENVIALYLQATEGFFVIPKTAERTAPKYEFVLINPANGARASLQVKSGNSDVLNSDTYSEIADEFDVFYLFASSGNYDGHPHQRIRRLDPIAIKEFVYQNEKMMPRSIRGLMKLTDFLTSAQHA